MRQIKDINPSTEIIPCSFGNISIKEIFGLGAYDPNKKSAAVSYHTMAKRPSHPESPWKVAIFFMWHHVKAFFTSREAAVQQLT